ncbi:MAG: S-layer homology domain-containing protein [Clostridiales bacterium]|nr:S-layer homology domain-containing protein [Clostridiales bacterium]
MKQKIVSLLLTLAICAVLSAPAAALTPADISGGSPSGIVEDNGALLITDTFNKVVWRVEGEAVSRFAGQINVTGLDGEPVGRYKDGDLASAMFMEPWAIVPFLEGWAVSDAAANVIRYIDDSGVRTAAGSGKPGNADGIGTRASFDRPTGLAAAPDSSLYIADTGNGSIRKMDTKGSVTTVLTGLSDPTGLCWVDGSLYIAETGRSRILRVTDGRIEVLAGDSVYLGDGEYEGGYVDGPAAKARFDHPQGVAVGSDGTVYIADTGNHAVRRLTGGRVTTIASAENNSTTPVQPRGLLLGADSLLVTDLFAQTLLDLSTAPISFGDVPAEEWYAEPVRRAAERGLTDGTGNGDFNPDIPVTRAMFAVMLSRLHHGMDGGAVIDGDASFLDVPDNSWYAAAVRWAADNQIIPGDSDSFHPSSGITREAAAALLYRYADFIGFDTSARTDLSRFSDASDVSAYAADAVNWAAAVGILNGNPDGTLAPQETATRAQAAKMLVTFMDVLDI